MGKKLFGTMVLGFDKRDVTSYIDKIVKEFELKIREKDNEIFNLKSSNKIIKEENISLMKKLNEIEVGKDKIANTLITANEKAESILKEAKLKAESEKTIIENDIEKEKISLNNIKTLIQDFKGEILKFSKGFEVKIEDMSGMAENFLKSTYNKEKNIKLMAR